MYGSLFAVCFSSDVWAAIDESSAGTGVERDVEMDGGDEEVVGGEVKEAKKMGVENVSVSVRRRGKG